MSAVIHSIGEAIANYINIVGSFLPIPVIITLAGVIGLLVTLAIYRATLP